MQALDNLHAYREAALNDFGRRLLVAARQGYLGPDVNITDVETVAGPRAGALHIFAGLGTGKLQRALSAHEAAIPIAILPEEFVGRVHVYRHERFLRIEAPWVSSLQVESIPLHRMTHKPDRAGGWTVGIDEYGRMVRASFNTERTPHYLIAGTTGAGKTEALISIIVQAAAQREMHHTRFAVIDGKRGRLMVRRNKQRLPPNLRNLIGPIATEPDQWRAVAVWCEREMQARFSTGYQGKIIIVIDELPEVIADAVTKAAIKRIGKLGRDVEVHLAASAQHPTVDNVGGSDLLRCLVGRVGFLVTDPTASRVVVGGNHPRLDVLGGAGDGYAMSPRACCRILGPIVTAETVSRMGGDILGDPVMDTWPEACAETLGQSVGRPSPWPTGVQFGEALMCASKGRGRPYLRNALADADEPENSTNRLRDLMEIGKGALSHLKESGWTIAGPPDFNRD